jgi:hypothetical protein
MTSLSVFAKAPKNENIFNRLTKDEVNGKAVLDWQPGIITTFTHQHTVEYNLKRKELWDSILTGNKQLHWIVLKCQA